MSEGERFTCHKKNKTFELINLRAPQLLGEGALLKGDSIRSASLRAVTDVEAYILGRKDFNQFILNDEVSGENSIVKQLDEIKAIRSYKCKKQVKRSLLALDSVKRVRQDHLKAADKRPSTSYISKQTCAPSMGKTKDKIFRRPETRSGYILEKNRMKPLNNIARPSSLSRSGGGRIGYSEASSGGSSSSSSSSIGGSSSLGDSVGWPFAIVSVIVFFILSVLVN